VVLFAFTVGIVWVFVLFYLIDRNNFDFDGQQFEIEKAKSNNQWDLLSLHTYVCMYVSCTCVCTHMYTGILQWL
jgi:hypothetical protein